jgi:Derlin-2/3
MSKPVFTRTYMAGSVMLGLLTVLNILTPYHLYYNFESGILKMQLWRLLTTVLFHGKLSFSFIFSMYFAHFAINNVETQLFDRRTSWADFLWLLILLHFAGIVIASFFAIYFTSDAFVFALMYIWCKRRPF